MWLLTATNKWHPDDIQPNVIVPFGAPSDPIWKSTRLNLEMQGLYPRYESLNQTLVADYAYDTLFRKLWAEAKPFILVEQDILPWPTALKQLWECDCPWGAYSYYILGELKTAMGCTKFDPLKLGECPLPEEPVHWTVLDRTIIKEMVARGHEGHLHGPPVIHLNHGHQRMTRSMRGLND